MERIIACLTMAIGLGVMSLEIVAQVSITQP